MPGPGGLQPTAWGPSPLIPFFPISMIISIGQMISGLRIKPPCAVHCALLVIVPLRVLCAVVVSI